jgi:hypothetical protein
MFFLFIKHIIFQFCHENECSLDKIQVRVLFDQLNLEMELALARGHTNDLCLLIQQQTLSKLVGVWAVRT